MEIFDPYVNGFKFLFFTKKKEKESISLLKVLFFLSYIIAILSGFLQFTNLSSNSLNCEISEDGIEECFILTGFFGGLFHLCTIMIIIGAFSYIFYSSIIKEKKTKYTYLSLIIAFLIILTLISLLIVFFVKIEAFYEAFNAIGNSIVTIWFVIFEPILFFSGLLIIIDIIEQDYILENYGKRTIIFLVTEILIVLCVIILIFVWIYNTNSNPDIFNWFYYTKIFSIGVDLVLRGLEVLLLIIFFSIILFFIFDKLKGKNQKREHLKSILPWIVLYSFFFFILRGIPVIFIFGYELKSITDLIDVSLVFLVIFFGIMQVISIPESKKEITRSTLFNPLKWTDNMPKYSKILLLLFLGAEIFYQDLQENAIAVLTGEVNNFTILKASTLVGFIIVGFISVYFRYHTRNPNLETLGPIKFIKSELSRIRKK